MEPVERKFTFVATSLEHGRQHTEADAMVFLAKDRALPNTLRFYRQECIRLGAAPRQLDGIELLIERVECWQRENPDQLKVPDVDEGPTGDSIVAPNE